jgi:glycosyltransferase involved in cell wall biosynthesis
MINPYFSIIMPLYNHQDYVGQAINSVLSQTYQDFELIICNDGSTDNSLSVVESFLSDRIHIINKPNGGTVSALNSALMMTKGKYICWLSSDDLYASNKLECHHKLHANNPEYLMSISSYGLIINDLFYSATQKIPRKEDRMLQFIEGNYINGLAPCVDRSLYVKYGVFNPSYKYAHDVERWANFLRHVDPAFIDGGPLVFSRMGSSIASNADLFGLLDVIKFLAHSMNRYGLRYFVPNEFYNESLTIDQFNKIINALFGRRSLFRKLNLNDICLEVIAAWLATQSNTIIENLINYNNISEEEFFEIQYFYEKIISLVSSNQIFSNFDFNSYLKKSIENSNNHEYNKTIEKYIILNSAH